MDRIALLSLVWLWSSSALSAQIQPGDQVSFTNNHWVWTVQYVRTDLKGASLVTEGSDGSERRLFIELERIFPVFDEVSGIEAGFCYKYEGNTLIWKVLALTPAIPGLVEETAYMYNPDVRPNFR